MRRFKDVLDEVLERMSPDEKKAHRLKEDRFKANLELVAILAEEVLHNPDLRFGQILMNLDFLKSTFGGGVCHDPYHEEPWVMLERVTAQISVLQKHKAFTEAISPKDAQ